MRTARPRRVGQVVKRPVAVLPGLAKLAGKGPAAEHVPSGLWIPLAPCDATASGAEDAQVRLVKGHAELALCAHHFGELEFILAVAGWRGHPR